MEGRVSSVDLPSGPFSTCVPGLTIVSGNLLGLLTIAVRYWLLEAKEDKLPGLYSMITGYPGGCGFSSGSVMLI